MICCVLYQSCPVPTRDGHLALTGSAQPLATIRPRRGPTAEKEAVVQAAIVIPPVVPPASTPRPHSLRRILSTTLPPVGVLVAALVVAALDYAYFLDHHRQLWTGTIHDRHAHYLTALSLALDLRQADIVQGLHDFDRARVWPPLHALLAAAVLAVGGPDYRLAVLPSLLAFVGTVLLGFLVARRAAPRGGNFAGLAAALLILTSTPHRAFATDVMLESLARVCRCWCCISICGRCRARRSDQAAVSASR